MPGIHNALTHRPAGDNMLTRHLRGYVDPEITVDERLGVIPLGKYSDGSVRLAWPEMAGLPGFERAQEKMAADGAPDPRNPEAVMALADDTSAAAGGAATGGLLASQMKPAGALGIFGGKLAKTADHAKLARAEEMTKAGADRDAIWNETGWFQGADGKWRFEIDDSNAKTSWWRNKGPLRKVLKHPDLNEAYPDVGSIRTKPNSGRSAIMSGADYQPRGKGLFGGWRQPEEIRTSSIADAFDPDGKSGRLLHEAQHAIQKREGFARGANQDEYSYSDGFNDDAHPRFDHARAAISVYADEAMHRDGISPTRPVLNKERDKLLQSMDEGFAWDKTRKEYETRAHDELNSHAYQRSAGEVEARNVQARQDMTAEERRAAPPWRTESVPANQQFVQEWGQMSPIPKPRGAQPAAESIDNSNALPPPAIDGERVNASFPFSRLMGRGGQQAAAPDTATLQAELSQLQARHAELFGEPYRTPQPPGGPTAESMAADIGAMQSRIQSREAANASRAGGPSVPAAGAPRLPAVQPNPNVAARVAEFGEIQDQVAANPYVQTRDPASGRFVKKAEEKRLINDYYARRGEPITRGPWGREPTQYQDVAKAQQQFEQAKRGIATAGADVAKQQAAARSGKGNAAELKRVQAELERYRDMYNQLAKIIKPDGE